MFFGDRLLVFVFLFESWLLDCSSSSSICVWLMDGLVLGDFVILDGKGVG